MNNVTGRGRVVVRVLLFLVGCAIMLAVVAPLAGRVQGSASTLFVGTVASLGAWGLSLLFVRWDGIRLADIGARPDRRSALRVALGFGLGLLLVGLHTVFLLWAGHVQWVRATEVDFREAIVVVLGFFALSCRESLGFHGYPLRRLDASVGLWPALLMVAAVFAVEHAVGGYTWGRAFAGAGVGSLLFGMASLTTRGLAVPIGLHAAWNCADWARGGKGTAGLWKPVVADGFEAQAQWVGMASYDFLMLAAVLAFWWWHRRGRRHT